MSKIYIEEKQKQLNLSKWQSTNQKSIDKMFDKFDMRNKYSTLYINASKDLSNAQQKMMLLIAHDHARLCDFLRDSSVLSKITQPFAIIAN